MGPDHLRSVCWRSTWNDDPCLAGLEHLLVGEGFADSVILAFDDQGPFRLTYRLSWDPSWRLREAALSVATAHGSRSLELRTDGCGNWRDGAGHRIDLVAGCLDIDIWPTPFTNSFPIRREPLSVGERRRFRMAWISAPDLTIHAQPQAYTRLADSLYRFESLDGSGFTAELAVDEDGLVVDYPGLFRRVQ